MKKIIILIVLAFTFVSVPNQTKALELERLIDPFCLFACEDEDEEVNYTYTNSNNTVNSNNVNSNVNSTNSTVNVSTGSSYDQTPNYYYDNDQHYYGDTYQKLSPLGVACYANKSSIEVGETVTWRASSYGGTGNYNVSWSGTNGLSGSGTSITKRYNSHGTKNATVTVRSGNQTVSRNCDSVEVYDYDRDYDRTPDYDYDHDYYDYDRDYYRNLYVSCSANDTYVNTGDRVVWEAYATGGRGGYSYRWSGTDSLSGRGRAISTGYNYPGTKTASVTVTSDGRSVTQRCSNYVTVAGHNYVNYPPQQYVTPNLQVACYPDKTSVRIGSPITWRAEVVGGSGNYAYTWIGTNGLSGNQSAVFKSYPSSGTKSATVTVTDSNGQSAVKSCGTTVYVQGTTVAKKTEVKIVEVTVTPTPTPTPSVAASLFSLQNVPWGWVAVLVILVLLFTVIYLIMNSKKI